MSINSHNNSHLTRLALLPLSCVCMFVQMCNFALEDQLWIRDKVATAIIMCVCLFLYDGVVGKNV